MHYQWARNRKRIADELARAKKKQRTQVSGYKFDARAGRKFVKTVKKTTKKKTTLKKRISTLEKKMRSAQIEFKVKDYAITRTLCLPNALEGGIVEPWNAGILNNDLLNAPDGVGGVIDLRAAGTQFAPYCSLWSQINLRNNYNQRVQVDCYGLKFKKGASSTGPFNMWKLMVQDSNTPAGGYSDTLVLNGYPSDQKAFRDQFVFKVSQRSFLDPGDEMILKYADKFRHDINADITNQINQEAKTSFVWFWLIRGTHAHTDVGTLNTTAGGVDVETKTTKIYYYDASGSGQFVRYNNGVVDPGVNVIETYGPTVAQETGFN